MRDSYNQSNPTATAPTTTKTTTMTTTTTTTKTTRCNPSCGGCRGRGRAHHQSFKTTPLACNMPTGVDQAREWSAKTRSAAHQGTTSGCAATLTAPQSKLASRKVASMESWTPP